MTKTSAPGKAHRPQAYTVFGAAIVAGAAAAFGLNSALDTHLAQARPQVESEAILVALRPLPAGAPVTVWDVGLRDWPKAMVPSTAMRVTDDLDNLVVRHPLREGQPILAVQLGRVDMAVESVARPLAVAAPPAPPAREPERDLWDAPPTAPAAPMTSVAAPPASTVTTVSTTFATATSAVPTPTVATPVAAATTAAPAAASVSTRTPDIVAAERQEQAPPEEEPKTVTVAPSPAPSVVSILERPSEEDSPAFPPLNAPTAADAPTLAVSPASPSVEAPLPDGIRPPAETRGDASPPMVRTALRPRPSVVQALAVPDRSALTGDSTRPDGVTSSNMSDRVASAITDSATASIAASESAAEPPRILPTGRDAGSTGPATPAPAARAPQTRPRATPAAPRSTRSQGFTKGYRPN